MSRQSDAKRARRRRRRAAGSAAPIPDPPPDEIGQAVAAVNDWIVGRGWEPDTGNLADGLISWVYPPSAAEFTDEEREPVTRIWISVKEDDEAVVLEFGAALVGSGSVAGEGLYLLDPETLAVDIAALEAYRPGLARPEFA